MSKRAAKHLKKYDAACAERNLHVSLTRYIADPESVDAQIDVLGAMHQSMWLSNQTGGYLKEFTSSADERIKRAFHRLLNSPYDDCALRVLIDNKLLISANELARLLNVSSRTVWRLNSTQSLPKPVKLNRSVRWILSDIQKWIANGCPNSADHEFPNATEDK